MKHFRHFVEHKIICEKGGFFVLNILTRKCVKTLRCCFILWLKIRISSKVSNRNRQKDLLFDSRRSSKQREMCLLVWNMTTFKFVAREPMTTLKIDDRDSFTESTEIPLKIFDLSTFATLITSLDFYFFCLFFNKRQKLQNRQKITNMKINWKRINHKRACSATVRRAFVNNKKKMWHTKH